MLNLNFFKGRRNVSYCLREGVPQGLLIVANKVRVVKFGSCGVSQSEM